MPSLKAKKAAEAGGEDRRKAPAAPGVDRAPPQRPGAAEAARKSDLLDYSRFRGIGEDSKAERLATGDVTWDELNGEEKGKIWKAEEQMEAILEQKRKEEDAWKRQLKEKPSDLSWVQGRHFASYEAFCVGRVEATLKKAGNDAFKQGRLQEAEESWRGGIDMILALGELTPEAHALLCILRNNLAQLYVKRQEWDKAKEMADKVLDRDPTNEKALFRRAQVFLACSIWDKCDADLDLLAKHHPENKDAASLRQQVHRKLGRDRIKLGGKAVDDIAAGVEELSGDGTVRKLRIEEYGEGDPDEKPRWLKPEWLSNGQEKVVVTCQMTIWSHGGEELYNSREYRPRPDTKQARDELKEYMDMVNFLDQEAKKTPRMVGDFYKKVKKRPVRWYVGDPGMYKGFDLAIRSMRPKEKALFEVDQPALSPSVESFYQTLGYHSGIAGLPQLVYHIEEERLAILEDEVPEDELDLESKTQRGVRVELELLGFVVFRDVSQGCDGSKLHAVLHPGFPDQPVIRKGDLVKGCFFINRPFDGSLLVQNRYVEWRLGEDEGLYDRLGDNKEPLRPDGGHFVPKCVGQAILEAHWEELRLGALVEVRYRHGPELYELAPQYATQFEEARRESQRRGRKGGAMCSMVVQIFPPDFVCDDTPADKTGTVVDASACKDIELD